MRGKVRDVAADIGVKPLFRLGMEIVLNLTERCNRCGDEIAARHEGAVELAAFLIEPVAADYRDIRSEEHTSELQSLMRISYAVFCLKKKRHLLKLHRIKPNSL